LRLTTPAPLWLNREKVPGALIERGGGNVPGARECAAIATLSSNAERARCEFPGAPREKLPIAMSREKLKGRDILRVASQLRKRSRQNSIAPPSVTRLTSRSRERAQALANR